MSHRNRGRSSASWKAGGTGTSKTKFKGSRDDDRERVRDKSETSLRDRDEHRGQGNGRSSPAYSQSRSDNNKISAQARILAKVDTLEGFKKACQQIQDLLFYSENKSYMIRFFSCLTYHFQEAFKGITMSSWRDAGVKVYGKFFSTVYIAMDSQCYVVSNWLLERLEKKCERKSAVGRVVYDTILEAILHLSKPHTVTLTSYLLEVLDEVATAELFKKFCSIYASCLLHNRETPKSNFEVSSYKKSFIDIVLGWMVDENEQMLGEVHIYCYDLILHLEPYFRGDVDYVMSYITDLLKEIDITVDVVPLNLSRLFRIIKAISAFLSLGIPLDKEVVKDYMEQLYAKVNAVLTLEAFSDVHTSPACDVLIQSNELFALCQGIEGPEMRVFLQAQLAMFRDPEGPQDWPKDYLRKFISGLSCWVETVSFQAQPSEEVKEILLEVMPFLDKIQPFLSTQDQFHTMKVVHGLLRTRCILVLQKIYEWVVNKLKVEPGLEASGDRQGYQFSKDVDLVLLVLAYLSDIATNKSGSILSLWALNPSIIDLLLSLVHEMDGEVDYRVRCCSLELLKSHSIAHSHFVSSISSAKTYLAESPAQRFLASLMNFWIQMIRENDSRWNTWVFDWVSIFLKTSASYVSNLLETCSDFYMAILREFTTNSSLRNHLGTLMHWMAQDTHYKTSELILGIIRETCLRILLDNNATVTTKIQFSSILTLLPSVILLQPEFDDSAALFNAEPEESLGIEFSEEIEFMTHPEFARFLLELFVQDADKEPSKPTRVTIKSAVDFLIRLKLKTVVGRAQDFFGQLQQIFRRARKGGPQLPFWKLEFVYELEKKIILCINQSAFLPCSVPEPTRLFYVTNKKPCLEWLKRLVPDLIEIALSLRCYSMAYYYSTSLGDDSKAKMALLEMEDAEGLKGMGEFGGYYYLKGEYEKSEALLKKGSEDPASINVLKATLLKRTDAILNRAAASLEQWPENSKHSSESVPKPKAPIESLLKLPGGSVKTFVNVQLDILRNVPNLQIRGGVENVCNLNLFELLKVEEIAQNSKGFTLNEKQRIQTFKVDRMIQHGNLEYARSWLTRNSWDDTRNNLEKKVLARASTYKIFGDLLYKEEDYAKSASLLSSVYETVQNDTNMYGSNSPHLSNEFRAIAYLDFAQKIKQSDLFFHHITLTSPQLAEAFDGKNQLLQALYERSREAARSSSAQLKVDAWYQYATFAYDRSDDEEITHILKEVLKSNALHSYASYIKWSQKSIGSKQSKAKIMVAMIRLLKLYHQGHKFIPEDLLTNDNWLLLLPELAKLEELRPYLLLRFPQEASVLIATLEYGRKFRGFTSRRAVFDPATYAFTEASEEAFQLPTPSAKAIVSQPQNLDAEKEKTYADASCLAVVQEIERVGTTREEVWASAIQRISADWVKRVNILKKDLARDRGKNFGKVEAYVGPLLNYLTQLWEQTQKGNTPADVAFICRYSNRINEIISSLKTCSDADALWVIYEQIMTLSGALESSISSKLLLVNLSPFLAKFDFINCSPSISLPGFTRNVTVVGVQPILTCLPTKSKPKKMAFRGSDGILYEYLIKGNENLNIDAGIMQLLKIAQEFSGYSTRSYSVTPIGERGGLIQIVKNAVPLFVLYKKYLRRANLTERPSEMYWRLLNNLGYSDRSDPEGLKNVFTELVKETPSELIQRELLLCADDTQSWYRSMGHFTRDCAMGSTLGYVVGLGDRHLDNILLNPRHGYLIHVDFSILFGKGRSLKIPELVPFRLSQNLIAALQYPGVTGAFRVYLDKLLRQFKNYEDVVMFFVKNIAGASLLEERLPIDPEPLLRAEIQSTFELLRLRIGNVWKIMEILIKEISESVSSILDVKPNNVWNANTGIHAGDRLKKKLYRWRRLLANLDPLIQFLINNTKPTGGVANFHQVVNLSWNMYITPFWCHSHIDHLVSMKNLYNHNFQLTEATLQALLLHLPVAGSAIELNPAALLYSGEQAVDIQKTEAVVHTVRKRILSYDPSIAKILIDQATNHDNLAQMYEGWTAWV